MNALRAGTPPVELAKLASKDLQAETSRASDYANISLMAGEGIPDMQGHNDSREIPCYDPADRLIAPEISNTAHYWIQAHPRELYDPQKLLGITRYSGPIWRSHHEVRKDP